MTDVYREFIDTKTQHVGGGGFSPIFAPDCMFDFQGYLNQWGLMNARAAYLSGCGTGKTLLELVFSENIVRKTNGRVLFMTPNSVAPQIVAEGEKFGIEAFRSKGGKFPSTAKTIVSNYEQLKHFDPNDFVAFVGDEAGCLKDEKGVTRNMVTEFVKNMQYRLLATATPAPNSYLELGTLSEALGNLGHMDMMNRFFKNDLNNSASGRMHGKIIQWRFKGHAVEPFYRFVCSWARAGRKPSDFGFDDMVDRDGRSRPFILPDFEEVEHVVQSQTLRAGMLYASPAHGMRERREERRVSIRERCEKMAELAIARKDPTLMWVQLNPEGDLVEKLIPGCVQVSGADDDEYKEEMFMAFASGQIDNLVTKGKIGAWGMNFQVCPHQISFPDDSYEKYYQQIRRSLRFGQKQKVTSDIVMTEGDRSVRDNMQGKSEQADGMFAGMIEKMSDFLHIERGTQFTTPTEIPAWLS